MRYYGFPPCFKEDAKVLILGSFPSVKSRENSFFYGNKQNRFWSVAAKAYGEDAPQTNEEKRDFIFRRGLALWDMVTECEIKGSLDSNIKDYAVADLSEVLSRAPIKRILLNGGKAAEIFRRNYPDLISSAIFLPSTSPANVRFDEELWLSALRSAEELRR